MAIAQDVPARRGLFVHLLTNDFCPGFNKYVYWLKEPIGWFVLATGVSVMVGLYFSPIGWTIAASLVAIMALGVAWPLLAVWVTSCELKPQQREVHEGDECRMVLTARNRIPLPVFGLAVEGYLDSDIVEAGDQPSPTVALACVPLLCDADFSITVRPAMRGHYPVQKPKIACSFPFGIWTARREMKSVEPLTVWPKVYAMPERCPMLGQSNADVGDGQRGGRSGDFVGVRVFRRGDSPRHIHWAQSARVDNLIVSERGGPQCGEIDLFVETNIGDSAAASRWAWLAEHQKTSLAWRMRVAASIAMDLHQSMMPLRIYHGDSRLRFGHGAQGRRQILDAMADVPVGGDANQSTSPRNMDPHRIQIEVTAAPNHDSSVVVKVRNPNGSVRGGASYRELKVDWSADPAEAIRSLWQELSRVTRAA